MKKLPGVDIEKNGRINYNGKPINRFTVEGLDLTGGKYNQLEENIKAKDVKKAEVIEHDQPIKALQNKTFTDNVAMNIALKDSARDKLMPTLKPYMLVGHPSHVGGSIKEMTTVNDDVSKLATGDNEQGTPQENAEDDENASNEDKATNPPTEQENGENGANTEPDKATEEQQEDKVIIPQGKMRVTVICDGSLNIRRSAAWGNDNICGRAIRGQSYYVKEIHVVDGKKMVRTIGDLYLSGESEHVQFEQL